MSALSNLSQTELGSISPFDISTFETLKDTITPHDSETIFDFWSSLRVGERIHVAPPVPLFANVRIESPEQKKARSDTAASARDRYRAVPAAPVSFGARAAEASQRSCRRRELTRRHERQRQPKAAAAAINSWQWRRP